MTSPACAPILASPKSLARRKLPHHPDAHARRAAHHAEKAVRARRHARRHRRPAPRRRDRPARPASRSQIILDPGIGFGKSYAQDYELIARLAEFARLGFPLLVGTSRKKFIGRVLDGRPAPERVFGTAATVAACILNGAHIVRVHDVAEMAQVARVRRDIAPQSVGGHRRC